MLVKQRFYLLRLLNLFMLFSLTSLLNSVNAEQNIQVPTVSNLQTLAVDAKAKQLPIVLVYSAEDCDHCERLDQDVLRPLIISGELDKFALIRKVMIDAVESITDFNGKQRDAEYYSILRDVEVTPTIEFVDANGTQLVPPIIGYQSVDMYMSYFTNAIRVSKMIIAAQQRSK